LSILGNTNLIHLTLNKA